MSTFSDWREEDWTRPEHEPCARPGCGHPTEDHQSDENPGACGWYSLDKLIPDCPCPSYRSQAQQEAWEALARVVRQREQGLSRHADQELWLVEFVDTAKRLLEAYP